MPSGSFYLSVVGAALTVLFGGLALAGVVRRRVGLAVAALGAVLLIYGLWGLWTIERPALRVVAPTAGYAVLAVGAFLIFALILWRLMWRHQAVKAARAAALDSAILWARRVIEEGKFVFGPGPPYHLREPRNAHSFSNVVSKFNEAVHAYQGKDRDNLLRHAEEIRRATQGLRNPEMWARLEPLLEGLWRWIESVAPTKRHPTDPPPTF